MAQVRFLYGAAKRKNNTVWKALCESAAEAERRARYQGEDDALQGFLFLSRELSRS